MSAKVGMKKGRHRHCSLGPVGHRHRLLFHDHPVAGCRGLRRGSDHGPVRQLEPEAHIVCTNRNASGIVRGFGGQELKCILIPLLSLAMEKLEIDPFEFSRKKLCQARRRVLLAGRDLVHLSRRGLFGGHGQRAERFGWKEKWKGWLRPSCVDALKDGEWAVGDPRKRRYR